MPQHKRGPWSSQEDQLLLNLVGHHGAHNWVRISATIGTRSPKQCRERFHQNLKPNLNHEPITPEEGELIEQMVGEMGKRWAEIARRLRGRSDNAVKNWWNGSMNRRRRSHHARRQELVVRQTPAIPQQQQQQQQQHHQHQQHHHHHHQHHSTQQPLPAHYQQQAHIMMQHQLHPQYYPIKQRNEYAHSMPANAPFGRLIESPLHSPSTFSQLSGESAPSLVSDTSSTRSPNNGSPIELPPLSGARDERATMLGTPFHAENEYMMPYQRMDEYNKHAMMNYPQQQQQQQHPRTYMPRSAPIVGMPHYMPFAPPPPAHVLKSQQTQLPSIADVHASRSPKPLDAARSTPTTTPAMLDNSPKDKMSLSNLTS